MTETGPACPFAGPAAIPGETGRARPPRRGYLVPGVIALVVCAALAVVIDLVGLQSHTPTTLVGSEIATDISQAIQSSRGDTSPPEVRCPASEPMRAGTAFDCTLLQAGRPPTPIRVSETGSTGGFHFVVGRTGGASA
jgi:hypothetical protein